MHSFRLTWATYTRLALVFLLSAAVVLLARRLFGFSIGSQEIRESLTSGLIVLLLLSCLRKRWTLLYFATLLIPACLYGTTGLTYGPPDQNAVAALLNTNLEEASEFLSAFPVEVLYWYGALALLCAVLMFVLKKKDTSKLQHNAVRIVLVVAIVAMSCSTVIRSAIKHKPISLHDIRLTEFSVPYEVYNAYESYKLSSNKRSLLDRQNHWTLIPKGTPSCEVCVFVMGESVRRDFMHAYGAPWKNTPWMSKTPGKLFSNMLSSSSSTSPSLSASLYAYEDNAEAPWADNIMSLAKKAGYYTEWISNQDRGSGADSAVFIASTYADKTVFERQKLGQLDRSDNKVLDDLKEAIQHQGKVLVFVHLWGSHPLACNRTDNQYDDFFVSNDLSCYIKSIKNTDNLLASVANIVNNESKGRSWGLIYTADHGLDFQMTRDGWMMKHDNKHQQSFQVPFFVTGSKFTKHEIIEANRSARYLPYMLANWFGYEAQALVPVQQCNWLENVKCEDQTKVRPYYEPFRDISTFPSLSIQAFKESLN